MRQESFNAGEIAPILHGRKGLEKYAHALRLCRNFLPLVQGPVENRTGFVYCGAARDSAHLVRLIPFTFAAGQNYVLEFSQLHLRVWLNGLPVRELPALDAWGAGVAYVAGNYVSHSSKYWVAILAGTGHDPDTSPTYWTEVTEEDVPTSYRAVVDVTTPYLGSELARLKHAQSGDLMTICHPAHPVMDLTRWGHQDWRIAERSFLPVPAFFHGGAPKLRAPGLNYDFQQEETGYVAHPWKWGVTTIFEDPATGRRWESAVYEVTKFRSAGFEVWTDTKRYVSENVAEWDRPTTYSQYDGVELNGVYYWALQASTDKNPETQPLFWQAAPTTVSVDSLTGVYYTGKNGASIEPGQDPRDTGSIYWDGPHYDLETPYTDHVSEVSFDVDLPNDLVCAPGKPVTLAWPKSYPAGTSEWITIGWRVYRGQGQVNDRQIYGWVGDVSAESAVAEPPDWTPLEVWAAGSYCLYSGYTYIALENMTAGVGHEPADGADPGWWMQSEYPRPFFIDLGADPDLTVQPPSGLDPFAIRNSAGEVTGSEYPSVVTYHDGRLVLANTFEYAGESGHPATLYFSKVNDYSNFDRRLLVTVADDSLSRELASRGYEEIRSLVSMRRLLALTSEAEWTTGGVGGDPVSALSFEARRNAANGATWLDPLLVGSNVLYVQEAGARVRDLQFDQQSDGYRSADLALWSRHLFERRDVVDWAFVKEPHPVIWAVMDDGTLRSCTYEPDQEVVAWARHDTDGVVESVCAVTELVTEEPRWVGDTEVTRREVGVYFLVARTVEGTVYRMLERLASRNYSDVRESIFCDSASGRDGRNKDPALTIWTSAAGEFEGYGKGDTFTVSSAGTPFTALSSGGAAGLVLSVDGPAPVRLEVVGKDSDSIIQCTCDLDEGLPAALRGNPMADWGIEALTVSVPHLEGKTIVGIADGVPFTATVTGETKIVTLPTPAVIVRLGLGYLSDLELLDLRDERGVLKTVTKVGFEVVASAALTAGETFDKLTPWRPPTLGSTGYAGTTGYADVRIGNRWNRHGRAVLRNAVALPVTVAAATREVQAGGS